MNGRGSIAKHVTPNGETRYRVRITDEGARRSFGVYSSEADARAALREVRARFGFAARPRVIDINNRPSAALRQLRPLDWPARGGVYFVMSAGLVKIGYAATNIAERLAQLRVGCPRALRLLAVAPGGQREERAAHIRFERDRVTGEWFRPSKRLVEAIQNIRIGWTPMDTTARAENT